MTTDTERDQVVEVVSVRLRVILRLGKRSNRNDVMHIRVPTNLSFRFRTNHAFVVVALQSCLPSGIPTTSVGTVVATLPVRMARASKRLREPLRSALLTTDGYFTSHFARIAFDGFGADLALKLDFSTTPSRIISSIDIRGCSPVAFFDAGGAV